MKKIKDLLKDKDSMKDMEVNEILSIVKNDINKDNIKDAAEIIKSSQIQRYIQYLISKEMDGETISDDVKQNLYLLIHILQTIYNYSGVDTGVSDLDYDRLYELLNMNGEELISTPVINGKIRHHRYKSLRGTLEKVYALTDEDKMANKSRKSLDDWIAEKERAIYEKTGDKISLKDVEIYVFPKWDGVSLIFEFNENGLEYALTRGNTDTNEAQDVTFVFSPIVSRIEDKKMKGKKYGLKTEVMMTTDDLEKYNKKYGTDFKNTRSIISSIVNSDTIDDRINLLDVVRLRTSVINEGGDEDLQELAENVFERPYLVCRMGDRQAIKDFANKHTFVNGLRCDGAVIYIKDENIRRILGRKDNKNQYEVAYKFNEEIQYSKITGITFSVTPFGRIFPTAHFEPKKMKGNKVENVSLGSIARFNELHLAVGDTVKILYEIIPYLVFDKNDPKCKRSDELPIQLPEFCPECGSDISYNENKTIAFCTNPDCGCRKRGKIINYITKLDIKGIGEETVNRLYDEGIVKSIDDLYKLGDKKKEIISLDGFGDDSYNNIMKALIDKSKISADRFMGAIGIECCGIKTFQKIFEKYTIEDLIEFSDDMKVSKLSDISGIGDKIALKILEGVRENEKLIRKMMKKYVNIFYEKLKDGKFIAVFHKIRSSLLTEELEKLGGVVEDNLTKKTNFLIVPNGFGDQHSGASDKARKYGCDIVEIDNVLDYVKGKF